MQQHKSLILVSHTLVAAVLRPFRNWLDSGLSRWLGPAEEYGASFPPSGSKTTTTVTRVEAMTIQLTTTVAMMPFPTVLSHCTPSAIQAAPSDAQTISGTKSARRR